MGGWPEVEHKVTLSTAFYCGKFEVTQTQWAGLVYAPGYAHFENAGGDAPVDNVDWFAARMFCRRLCKREGVPEGTYRLLTEAQWEYACRAGTTGEFCLDNADASLADYA